MGMLGQINWYHTCTCKLKSHWSSYKHQNHHNMCTNNNWDETHVCVHNMLKLPHNNKSIIKVVVQTWFDYDLASTTSSYTKGASLQAPSFSRTSSLEHRRLRGSGMGGFSCLFGSLLLTSLDPNTSSWSSSNTLLRRTLDGTVRCSSVEGLLLMLLKSLSLLLLCARVGR